MSTHDAAAPDGRDFLAQLTPIVGPVTVEETVARELRSLITEGKIAPGVRLRYRELAGRFGVSVTPVRIAVRDLAKEGLLEMTDRGLVRVPAYSLEEIDELYSQRAGLEGLLARRGAEQLSPAALKVLNARLERVNQAAVSEARADYLKAIWTFRLTCYEAAQRPRVLDAVELLVQRCARYNRLTLDDVERFHGSLEFQHRFAGACRLLDGETAEAVIRAAMDWSREYLVARLRSQIGRGSLG